jgi:hypothetical protein
LDYIIIIIIIIICLHTFVYSSFYFQGRPVPSPNTNALAEKRRKFKDKRDSKERDRARKITLISMAQEETIKAQQHLAQTLKNPEKMALANAVMRSTNKKLNAPEVVRVGSGVSLDYSVDSGLMGENSTMGGSALMGQQFATDGSVMSSSSRGPKSAAAARMMGTTTSSTRKDDDSASAFSLQESTSSLDQERVPTDEELFRLGWAKAMDPKSGSYYYFTLDRSKIVWDNPLVSPTRGASSESMDSGLPQGAAAI